MNNQETIVKSGRITPLQRLLQLPLGTRDTLLEFLDANTRTLGDKQDAEVEYILQLTSLNSKRKTGRTV